MCYVYESEENPPKRMTFKVTRHIGGRKEAERGSSQEFLARGVYIRRRRSANSFEKNDPNNSST